MVLQMFQFLKQGGNLTDHYDPSKKLIKLSTDIYNGTSIASCAVAAHECGHAIQDKDNYIFFKIIKINLLREKYTVYQQANH